MKHNKMSKLIAVVAAGAMLLSSFTASAKFALTADKIFDSANIGNAAMLSGFSMDSKDYAWQTQGEYNGNYGIYHPHMNWEMNRTEKNWNAEASMQIYPIGTPDTDYSAINSEDSFFAEPYAMYTGTDLQIWNGYMFVVMEKTTWAEDADANGQADYATFDSVIQVYDIANGAKTHVATWTTEDLGLGGTAEGVTYGIREIEVTDDNIFALVDMGGTNWTYKYDWGGAPLNTMGCGLAIFDNNISRVDDVVDVPTRSNVQPMGDANSDMAKYGVDTQMGLAAVDSLNNGAKLVAVGDYLLYLPSTNSAHLKSLHTDPGATWLARGAGAYWVKWNEERTPGQKVAFTQGTTLADWLPLPTFPEDYKGMENWNNANYAQMGAMIIDGTELYADIAYTKPDTDGVYHQYDQLFIFDISNPVEPTLIGQSAELSSPAETLYTNRVMTVDEDYVYIAEKHYHHFDGAVVPYILVIDKQDMENPVCVNEIALRDYQSNAVTKGAESVTAIANYLIVHSNNWTIFLEMSEDRTEVVDSVALEYMMAISDQAGGVHGSFVYGTRIFYPSLHGTVAKDGWRFDNRIEVIDFIQGAPMGIYVDEVANNGDDTYTISGTLETTIEMSPAYFANVAIMVNDAATDENVAAITWGELDADSYVENNVYGWSFTTDADMPTNLDFVLTDEWGDDILNADGEAYIYENVNMGLIGVDPVFTFTGTPSGAIAQGAYTVTPHAANTTAKPVNGVVVVAVYDAEGKMVAVTSGAPEGIDVGDDKDLTPVTVTVPAADSYENYTAKAFLLNSVEGLAPVCPNLVF